MRNNSVKWKRATHNRFTFGLLNKRHFSRFANSGEKERWDIESLMTVEIIEEL